jgi:hypothetical protein
MLQTEEIEPQKFRDALCNNRDRNLSEIKKDKMVIIHSNRSPRRGSTNLYLHKKEKIFYLNFGLANIMCDLMAQMLDLCWRQKYILYFLKYKKL